MVIPSRLSPRPQWAKTNSWRRYIKVSNRKLHVEGPTLPFQQGGYDEKHVKLNEASNTATEIPVPDSSLNESIWYQRSDYESFEKDRQLTALEYRTRKRNGRIYIEREHSIRGLEELCDVSSTRTSEDNETKTTARAEHLRRVLQEQTRQRTKGIHPPNTAMLREVSCKSSREARQRSAQLGESDALSGHVSSSKSLQRQVSGVMHNISRKLQA